MKYELNFDEQKHIYSIGSEIIPSVSEIMRPLSTMKYGDVDPAVLAKAAEKGTAVHEAAELYLRYGFEDCPEEHKGFFDGFKAFVDEHKPEVIETEKRLFHPIYRYAGTADLVCKIDGKITLVDYKTTTSVTDMLVRVQLEAYSAALKTEDIDIERKCILHLCKDGKYNLIDYTVNDAEAWRVFGSLKMIRDFSIKNK